MSAELDQLQAWQAGDEAAGRALVERHFSSVYRFFVNKVPSQASDLVQETFLACVEGRDRIQGGSIRTYLFGIARRRLYRYWREHRGAGAEDQSVSQLAAEQICQADALAKHQEQKLLLRGLRRLPLQTQILLELAYFEGFTDRELAEVEGIPVGTLKSRLRKARADLTEAMAGVGSEALLRSTTSNLDQWVQSMRAHLQSSAPG